MLGSSSSNLPIAFTDALPLAFEGAATVPNLSLRNVGKPPFDERQARILSDMYAGHHLEAAVRDGLELRQEVAQEMADEMSAANRGAINAKGFELEAERMGRLMRDKYRIGFIDVGGWDTHVGEGSAQGRLADNLANLGRGLQEFSQTLGSEWNNTVVVVLSEFGRTFRENGNRGTDHGHGTVYWVLGGAINGGTIVGEQRPVSRGTLFQDRDYPVLNDYRAVLGGLYPLALGAVGRAVHADFSASHTSRTTPRLEWRTYQAILDSRILDEPCEKFPTHREPKFRQGSQCLRRVSREKAR